MDIFNRHTSATGTDESAIRRPFGRMPLGGVREDTAPGAKLTRLFGASRR